MFLYFKWAPEYFEETEGERRGWLQDLGNWYRMSTDTDDWMVAASQQGKSLGDEGLGIVTALPGGPNVVEAGGNAEKSSSLPYSHLSPAIPAVENSFTCRLFKQRLPPPLVPGFTKVECISGTVSLTSMLCVCVCTALLTEASGSNRENTVLH